MQAQEPTREQSSIDLSIVIVSWNVWPLLQRCLASIERASLSDELTLEIIVVDNASQDNTPALVAEHFPRVQLIASDRNLGFTGGNNRGYAASHGRFVFFLNPDTELTQEEETRKQGLRGSDSSLSPSPLLPLYAAICADPTIGVIGPRLVYGDGSPQPSARRFPTPLTGFFESTWLGRAWPSNPWAQAMHMPDWPADRRGDVDWIVGAAMLCRRHALETICTPDGPFDEGFFMYSEEMDLCRRIVGAGWRVVYDPATTVIHHEGKSSEQVSTRRHILFNTSKVRYWRKWFGSPWSEALRRYLLLEYHIQSWVERAKLWLGSKPELRRVRVAAYKEVLASGLRPPVK